MDLFGSRQSLDSLDFDFQDGKLLETTAMDNTPSRTDAKRQKRQCRYPTCTQLLIIALLALVAILLPLSISRADRHDKISTGIEFGTCGTNRTTAIANGCIFDNLSYAWARPACHHASLLKTLQSRHEIKYYYSSTLSPENRIPIQEIMDGKHVSAWAEQEQHPIHCAFMLSKLHEAFMNGGPTDNLVREEDHTAHCTQILLDNWLHEVEPCAGPQGCISKVNMKFTHCGYS
ncbi:hypothetical protein BJ878DRAFT_565388 [Calycina marina]|uniref:Uncharacterized protein n=1 Tax=Calycina marina TaxID=1763456 RepID=A0A9P7Z7T1_9HELO|nr:hypothetical protein BJ878DRAFT_565388 [Calycina marina]